MTNMPPDPFEANTIWETMMRWEERIKVDGGDEWASTVKQLMMNYLNTQEADYPLEHLGEAGTGFSNAMIDLLNVSDEESVRVGLASAFIHGFSVAVMWMNEGERV